MFPFFRNTKFNTCSLLAVFVAISTVSCLPHQKDRGEKKAICLNYMEDCNPFYDMCCEGQTCVNLRKGFCAFPHERCVCQKKMSANIDQWELY